MEEKQFTLRDRKRRAVQQDVMQVAVDLFVANGYESTTVDHIATAAGLSPRSFFRYFATKEAVVTYMLDEVGTEIATRLTARPPEEHPWYALRRAFDGQIESLQNTDRALPMIRLIYDTPVLHSSHLHKQVQWHEAITEALTPRLTEIPPNEDRTLRAGALAVVGISCLEYARFQWVRHGGERGAGELLDLAMSAVAPLTGP